MNTSPTDLLCINTLRFLAVDAIEKASSGHPGAPLGAAPTLYTLWDRFLKHNPQDPRWFDRDRFILSAGHASALLYALLHMTGYEISLTDLQNFRQMGAKAAGHPEFGHCPGVEATTGPLGQGLAMGVGLALAESHLAAVFNKPSFPIINHFTYVFCSDGDLMEGISSEAASLAGTLKLGKLICLYDDNKISIEGDTQAFFSEDLKMRFLAFGWQVIGPIDGNDVEAVSHAITAARQENDRPTIIINRTVIGYGSPNRAGSAKSHGEPLGPEETKATKQALGWDPQTSFYIPEMAKNHLSKAIARGLDSQQKWQHLFNKYRDNYPSEAQNLLARIENRLSENWQTNITKVISSLPQSTREASGQVLNHLSEKIDSLMGGSADLGPSNKSIMLKEGYFSSSHRTGRNIRFGVREQAMGAIVNGMALHGGIRPYGATFLAFYDYMRAPIRLAALMKIPSIFLFSHDSIGMGEDGPTHQPIEHILGLRSVPNLVTLRPADGFETTWAWQIALNRNGPTAILTSRQKVSYIDRSTLASAEGTTRGGYTLWQSALGPPDLIIIATGSEVSLALSTALAVSIKCRKTVRVVSLPSWELFNLQPLEYRNQVLPPECPKRISVEAASTIGWSQYAQVNIGVNSFGLSAPAEQLFEYFGLTVENISKEAIRLLEWTEK